MSAQHRWDRNRIVLEIPQSEFQIPLSLLMQAVLITGSSGSGKSSSSFRALIRALIDPAIDAGGIFFVAKSSDYRTYLQWFAAADRLDDVIVVSSESGNTFDVFRYMHLTSRSDVENIVALPMELLDVMERGESSQGGDGAFWMREVKKTLRMAASALLLADFPISLQSLEDMVTTAAQRANEVHEDDWKAASFNYRCLKAATIRCDAGDGDQREMNRVGTFWMKTWPRYAEKTRSIVEASIGGITSALLQKGLLRDMFASETISFVPEMCENGALVLVQLPSLEDTVNVLAQVLMKSVWQRAMLKRLQRLGDEPQRPVIFAMDEAQKILTNDHEFLQVSRAASCISIFATQNLSGMVDILGGDKVAETRVDNFLGNIGLHIAHAQSETKTQEHLANLCGRGPQWRKNLSGGENAGGFEHFTAGQSQQIDFNVPPDRFLRLRQGGPENQYQCDAYCISRVFAASNGKSYRKVAFSQK